MLGRLLENCVIIYSLPIEKVAFKQLQILHTHTHTHTHTHIASLVFNLVETETLWFNKQLALKIWRDLMVIHIIMEKKGSRAAHSVLVGSIYHAVVVPNSGSLATAFMLHQ